MESKFTQLIIHNVYRKILKTVSNPVDLNEELTKALSSYIDSIEWMNGSAFITGFKNFLDNNEHRRLSPEWKMYAHLLERNLKVIDKHSFDNDLTTQIMANIVSDPFIANFVNVQFVGTGDVSDKEYYFMQVSARKNDFMNISGFSDSQQLELKKALIADAATFDYVSQTMNMPSNLNTQLREFHDTDGREAMIDAFLFEIHSRIVNNILAAIKEASTRSTVDVSESVKGFDKTSIDTFFDDMFQNQLNGTHIICSPDICSLMACSSPSNHLMLMPPYTNMPVLIYNTKDLRTIYVYRDIYADKSYMLSVNKRYNEGLIFHPGVGYTVTGEDGKGFDSRLSVTVTEDNDNIAMNAMFPFAMIDNSKDGTYQYVECTNVASTLGFNSPSDPTGTMTAAQLRIKE